MTYVATVWHGRLPGSLTFCKLTGEEVVARKESVASKKADVNCPECVAFMERNS